MKRRLQRIVGKDGRLFVVAMDHAVIGGPLLGLETPRAAVERVVAGGPDAIMTTFGTSLVCQDLLGMTGFILTLDSRRPVTGYGIEQALKMGADGIKVLVYTDSPDHPEGVSHLLELGAAASAWGLPLIAEMIPVSLSAKDQHTPEKVAKAARIGAECGADVVKVPFTGDAKSFETVVRGCPVPVVILGGAKGDDRDVLKSVEQALLAGAAGVTFGRNIWQHVDPKGITQAIAAVVHGGYSAEDAIGLVKRK